MTCGEPATSNFLLLCILSTLLLWVCGVTMVWIFNSLIAREQRKCLMDLSCRLTRLFNLSEWDVIHFMKILNFLFCASAVFLGLHGKHGTVMGHFLLIHSPNHHLTSIRKCFHHFAFRMGLTAHGPSTLIWTLTRALGSRKIKCALHSIYGLTRENRHPDLIYHVPSVQARSSN